MIMAAASVLRVAAPSLAFPSASAASLPSTFLAATAPIGRSAPDQSSRDFPSFVGEVPKSSSGVSFNARSTAAAGSPSGPVPDLSSCLRRSWAPVVAAAFAAFGTVGARRLERRRHQRRSQAVQTRLHCSRGVTGSTPLALTQRRAISSSRFGTDQSGYARDLSILQSLATSRPDLELRLRVAVEVAREAATLTKALQRSVVDGGLDARKDDDSIVTVGDFAVQAHVLSRLAQCFPEDGFLAEESSDLLKREPALAQQVLQQVASIHSASLSDVEALSRAIDLASKPSENAFRWVLDPIDGTRGFKEGQHFCIGLGLLERGTPSLGLLACPNDDGVGGRGRLFVAAKDHGSYALRLLTLGGHLNEKVEETFLQVRETSEQEGILLMEGPFTMHALNRRVQQKLKSNRAPLRIDSMAKYGRLSAGEADLVLRLHTPGYREHIWDHLPGVLVLEEAGGKVTDQDGNQLDFSVEQDLPSSVKAIVSSRGEPLHGRAIAAVREVLDEEGL